jgi:hypothetical protein
MSDKLLHTESSARYKHHMKMDTAKQVYIRVDDHGEIEIIPFVIK